MPEQGLECRAAVIAGHHAEPVKSSKHRAEIMRLPARQHPCHLPLEAFQIIAGIAYLASEHGTPDRRYVRPGQRVRTDEFDCGAGQRVRCGES